MDNSPDKAKSLPTRYELDEDSFKADTQACDRYITFSSELLRLSLIAIGGYGALVTIFLKDRTLNLSALKCSWGLFTSAVLFGACAGATLFHRFWASDSMAWYISYLRKLLYSTEAKQDRERQGFYKTLKIGANWLIAAEFLFAFAVIAFIVGINQLLFVYS